MDNTHNENRDSGISSGPLPLADDRDAIARTLWELTDREYRKAAPAYAKVMTNNSVEAVEEDKSPDFSKETSQAHVENAAPPPSRSIRKNGKRKLGNIPRSSGNIPRSIVRRYPCRWSSRLPILFRAKAARWKLRALWQGWWSRPARAPMTEWNLCASRLLNRRRPTDCHPKRN